MTLSKNILKSQSQIRKTAIKSYLIPFQWDHFITLTFKHPKSHLECTRVCGDFVKTLNNLTFGRNSQKSVRIFIVIEPHSTYGYHVHALVQDPTSRINPGRQATFSLSETLAEAWDNASFATARPDRAHFSRGMWSSPPTKRWFEKIYDVRKNIDYVLKTIDIYQDVIQWQLFSNNGRRLKII